MKKQIIVFLVLLMILTGCGMFQAKEKTDTTATFSDDSPTYKYTIEGDDKEYELSIPEIKLDDDDELTFNNVYSLNPLQQPKGTIPLVSSKFYQNDGTPMEAKDRLYDIARFGYGYYELTLDGYTKLKEEGLNTNLSAQDFQFHHGDSFVELDYENEQDVKWYLATQALLWEQLVNPDTLEAFKINFEMDILAQKAEILRLVDNPEHLKPNFGGTIQSLNEQDIEKEKVFTFTDQSANLHNFDFIVSDGLEIIEHQEHTIKVKVLKDKEKLEISFKPRFVLENNDSYYFSSNKNYGYFAIGNDRLTQRYSKLSFKVFDPITNIKLYVNTTDNTNNTVHLAGAKYQLSTDTDFAYSFESTVSSATDFAMFENLSPGKYYLRQLQAPTGFVLNQEVPQEIIIEAGISEKTIPYHVSPLMTPAE